MNRRRTRILAALAFLCCSMLSVVAEIEQSKNAGSQPIFLDEDLTLSVDPTANTASSVIHLLNPTDKEMTLALCAGDFTTVRTHRGIGTRVLFTQSGATAGQQICDAKIGPGATIELKLELSGFWEAGAAEARLLNRGKAIGSVHAIKFRPAFAVKIVSASPEKPEVNLTRGATFRLTLKNDDPMTYPILATMEIDGVAAIPVPLTLPPSGSAWLEIIMPEEWFNKGGRIKEQLWDGSLSMKFRPPGVANQAGLPERIIPIKAHVSSVGRSWLAFWQYLFALVCVTMGGASSLVLSNWIPNRISRADLKEQLGDLARQTRDLSSRIDSGLRVLLRVERKRLEQMLYSRLIISAELLSVFKRCGSKIEILGKQIELATQLDRAYLSLEHGAGGRPVPTKIGPIERNLAKAADLLRRSDPNPADLDAAKVLILAALDQIGRLDEPDPQFEAGLRNRITPVTASIAAQPPLQSLQTLSSALRQPFISFARFSCATTFQPADYSRIDVVTTQMELIMEYLAYFDATKSPAFPEQSIFVEHLSVETATGLRQGRRLLQEIKENIFRNVVEQALVQGAATIIAEPPPIENGLVKFSIKFQASNLNAAAARGEVECEWDFGHDSLTEAGWEVFHYFPQRKTHDYKVSATFFVNGKPLLDSANRPVVIEKPIHVDNGPSRNVGDRDYAEAVRLVIVLIIALIGLLAGAREQIAKLDLVPAGIAIFMLGFGADTIKNLISPKQA